MNKINGINYDELCGVFKRAYPGYVTEKMTNFNQKDACQVIPNNFGSSRLYE